MPPCRDEDAAVVGGDLEQRRDALGERRAVGLHRLRAVGRERQDSDRAARCGQHVNTLVPVLQREVDQGLARDASSAARQVPGPESPRRGDLLGPGRRPPRVAELGAGIGLLLDHPGRGQDVVVGHDSPPGSPEWDDGRHDPVSRRPGLPMRLPPVRLRLPLRAVQRRVPGSTAAAGGSSRATPGTQDVALRGRPARREGGSQQADHRGGAGARRGRARRPPWRHVLCRAGTL